MISKNIWKDVIHPKTSDKELVLVSRICVVLFSLFAVYLALSLKMVYMLLALGFDLIMASLFAAMTLGLYWKKANGYGALAGMVAGALVRVVGSGCMHGFTLEGIGSPLDTWYYFTLGGPTASLAAMVVISLLTQKKNPPIRLELEADPSH